MIFRTFIFCAFSFVSIMGIGLVASLKGPSERQLDGQASTREIRPESLNNLIFASIKSVPFPILLRDSSRNPDTGVEEERVIFDFSNLQQCSYNGPIDKYFALAILSAESYNRPASMRYIDAFRFFLSSHNLDSKISVGPLQIQVQNISNILDENSIPNEEKSKLISKIFDQLETFICENLYLIGEYFSVEQEPALADLTFERYMIRIANHYRTGDAGQYSANLYTDVVLGAYRLLNKGLIGTKFPQVLLSTLGTTIQIW